MSFRRRTTLDGQRLLTRKDLCEALGTYPLQLDQAIEKCGRALPIFHFGTDRKTLYGPKAVEILRPYVERWKARERVTRRSRATV
jgi:hypothetical protein